MSGDGAPRHSLSHVRHELRTPLNQIIGYSQMLQEDASDRGQEDLIPDIKKVEAAARRMVELIDEFFRPSDAIPEAPKTMTAASVPAEASARSATLSDPAVRSGALLVVDDDEMNRDMLARRLQRKGYDVKVAVDGYEALKMVGASPFDLILLDVMMPGISGLDVLRDIRTKRSVADLPIIMATAMGASEDVVAALKDGANDYVTKPLDFSVVLARVETQLSLKRAKDEINRLVVELEIKNRFIQKTFGRYLSDEVVKSLLESPEGLALGGEKRHVTILMSDLRGFTSLAERVTPEQVVTILNNYLGAMADVILKCGGTIDEFIGDSVLAVFGAPVSRPDDAERAVACAAAMQLAMTDVNAENARLGLPAIEMGIALHTGDLVVGNIGSHKRAKYGVVGSPVNLTARIESYTVGGQVLISEATRREAGDHVSVGGEMAIRAKGIESPVTVYDLSSIGGKYGLTLPKRGTDLKELATPIAARFALIEEKHIEGTYHPAEILKLSPKGAVVHAAEVPLISANVSIRVTGGGGAEVPGDLYAKVTDRAPGAEWFSVWFTSVPPDVEAFFRDVTAKP
ncbi:MAG: adenylate/guanylate cyclase domain-containing protein [Acidobacteriota bacterium]